MEGGLWFNGIPPRPPPLRSLGRAAGKKLRTPSLPLCPNPFSLVWLWRAINKEAFITWRERETEEEDVIHPLVY